MIGIDIRRRGAANGTASGFTLLEMLVVLVLVALVVGLLFEGLGRVADLRLRLARHLDSALDSAIVASWFRSSVTSMLPAQEGAADAFRGGPAEMSGLTLQPLDQPTGAAVAFAWRLAPDASSGLIRLSYRGADGRWREVAAWSGDRARFLYAGPDGDWREEWPPPLGTGRTPLGRVVEMRQPQLPRFVRLEGGSGPEAWSTAAAVVGTTMAPLGVNDTLRMLR
jgi:prepilin-type N-terminal cleavage/methylation domain-containing protein